MYIYYSKAWCNEGASILGCTLYDSFDSENWTSLYPLPTRNYCYAENINQDTLVTYDLSVKNQAICLEESNL